MKFPLSWLREFLKKLPPPEKIAEILTLSGIEVEGFHPHLDDFIFEVSLTPNFGHALSLLGIAREIAAHLDEKVVLPSMEIKEDNNTPITKKIEIEIEEKKLAPRFFASMLFDVTLAPTPDWLTARLEIMGMRSVNLVVDVVNYVMLELGVPLHAFDYDKIAGHKLIIRKARPGEKLVTLDHIERFLTPEDLVIADSQKPLSLAGIMGGEESEVGPETRSILLEGAVFNAASIRRSAKRFDLSTDASKRFERGVDFDALSLGLNRASHLIQKLGGGRVAAGIYEAKGEELKCLKLPLRAKEVNRILGTSLSRTEIETLLRKLGFKTKALEDEIEVTAPTFRTDIKIEVDLIEEVARHYGYNNLYTKGKSSSYRSSLLAHNPLYPFSKKVAGLLLSEGLTEFLTCDLIDEKLAHSATMGSMPSRALIKLLNPHSQEQTVLRPTLLPNHLRVAAHNFDHGIHSFAAFEIGRIHFKEKDSYHEPLALAITLFGKRAPNYFEGKVQDFDFYDVKGILENLFEGLKAGPFQFLPSEHAAFHPGQQARITLGAQDFGIMGQIHPELLQLVGLSQPLFFAELSLEELAKHMKEEIKMAKLPLFPRSTRDWTLTVEESTQVGEVMSMIEKIRSPLLESYELINIFRSDKIGAGWKNVTLRFAFRAKSETISHAQVEDEMANIEREVEKLLGKKVKVGI